MSTKMAISLTAQLLRPLYEQIDPIKVAEAQRYLQIAYGYGERLNAGNLKHGTLDKLACQYPSHGFVIDREETRQVFNDVTNIEGELKDIVMSFEGEPNSNEPILIFLNHQQSSGPKSDK